MWDRTCIPYIARQILNHWTTREASDWIFLKAPSILKLENALLTFKKKKKMKERKEEKELNQMRNGGLKVMSINNNTLAP